MRDSARVLVLLLRLTTDGHKASRGLSETAELLVSQHAARKFVSPWDTV